MRKLLIAVGVLIVLLVIIDRVGVVVAEDQISGRIASAYGLPADPGVSIGGFPFLTQVVSGDYQQISVTADRIQADGATLHNLNVHLTGVHASVSQVLGSGTSTVTADSAMGTALVDFATVDQRLPHGLKIAPDGTDLKVSGTVPYRGIPLPVSATVTLRVTGAGIKVIPVHVTVAGAVSLPSSYTAQLHVVIPLSNLPLHLHLTSVHVTASGVLIGAEAQNVQFARA